MVVFEREIELSRLSVLFFVIDIVKYLFSVFLMLLFVSPSPIFFLFFSVIFFILDVLFYLSFLSCIKQLDVVANTILTSVSSRAKSI